MTEQDTLVGWIDAKTSTYVTVWVPGQLPMEYRPNCRYVKWFSDGTVLESDDWDLPLTKWGELEHSLR